MANSGEKFLYFVIGGFVGASVALLFAPKSGEETRNYLEGKYREGSEEVTRKVQAGREYVDETRKNLGERLDRTVEKGRDVIHRQKDQISTALEAGKRAYEEEKEKLTEPSSGESS